MAVVKRLQDTSYSEPYYLGTITNKKKSAQSKGAHAHYIVLSPKVAERLGMPKRSAIKKTDEYVGGAIFDTQRKSVHRTTKAVRKVDAKRYLEKGSKTITLFTGDYVKKVKGEKLEQEQYDVGFPSTLAITEILFFVHKRMPKVQIVRSGRKAYIPKNIKIPDVVIVADATEVAK
jgi:hypothetical protein